MAISKLKTKFANNSWINDVKHFFNKINELINYQTTIVLVDNTIVNWDIRAGYNASITLKGNRTLNITNLTPGDYGTLKIIQDVVGSRTLALSSNSIVMGTGGTNVLGLTTTASVFDIASFYYDGVTINWNLAIY